ncbi:hypothetical protein LTR37_013139 [Vermiconidia calcicola]|uniref:Uncharacterized protein n=1 Tax=Vermiconidia calcicola TaxID=1690605 RepID=A0ACC3MX51_9PEZI|nr:hypothetical protein LTR37_013139 [Vermiconidia calcicola]
MESPTKRLKPSPPQEASADFVRLGGDDDDEQDTNQYGYTNASPDAQQPDQSISQAPRAPRAMYQHSHHPDRRNARNDPRNAKDRPKSKHVLPNHEPWILVRTKLGRRFVHNTSTKESLWWIPKDVMPGVLEFERWEVQVKEKEANAKWAEEQLKGMRGTGGNAVEVGKRTRDGEGRDRRRRSESLQREDEEAMMAEIAKEAEKGEERDVKETVKNVEGLQPKSAQPEGGDAGYGSDSSYEEVEVTDSEFEDDEERQQARAAAGDGEPAHEQGPVEFGEDDIAYQLAAMENYGLDGNGNDNDGFYSDGEAYEEDAEEDDAAHIFRQMLSDHAISPFTPWETLIADSSPTSIILDDRYTILPTTRARKEVWEVWVKDTVARLKEERAKMEKQDPRIPYLAFLAEKASPKLYWPEFKRKFKKEGVMNERALGEKERERLYRDHINRLKLPESTRRADLIALLKAVPLKDLNKGTSMDTLPQQVLSHLHFISLPPAVRDQVISQHISTLPPAPASGEDAEEDGEHEREKDRKRAKALAERERLVEEERRKAEKEGRWAKRELREEERELERAMEVGKRGLRERLRAE